MIRVTSRALRQFLIRFPLVVTTQCIYKTQFVNADYILKPCKALPVTAHYAAPKMTMTFRRGSARIEIDHCSIAIALGGKVRNDRRYQGICDKLI